MSSSAGLSGCYCGAQRGGVQEPFRKVTAECEVEGLAVSAWGGIGKLPTVFEPTVWIGGAGVESGWQEI